MCYLIVCRRLANATIKVNPEMFCATLWTNALPVNNRLALAVGGGYLLAYTVCSLCSDCDKPAFNNQIAHLAHLTYTGVSGFLFVVLVFVLGQGGVPSYCDRVVHSFISVDRMRPEDNRSSFKLLDQAVSFSS
jgi:hypothetical protein